MIAVYFPLIQTQGNLLRPLILQTHSQTGRNLSIVFRDVAFSVFKLPMAFLKGVDQDFERIR